MTRLENLSSDKRKTKQIMRQACKGKGRLNLKRFRLEFENVRLMKIVISDITVPNPWCPGVRSDIRSVNQLCIARNRCRSRPCG